MANDPKRVRDLCAQVIDTKNGALVRVAYFRTFTEAHAWGRAVIAPLDGMLLRIGKREIPVVG